jgi:hypothetical protein
MDATGIGPKTGWENENRLGTTEEEISWFRSLGCMRVCRPDLYYSPFAAHHRGSSQQPQPRTRRLADDAQNLVADLLLFALTTAPI